MQIIVLHSRFRRARSLTLSGRHLVCLLGLFIVTVVGSAVAIDQLMERNGVVWQLPAFLRAPGTQVESEEAKKSGMSGRTSMPWQ